MFPEVLGTLNHSCRLLRSMYRHLYPHISAWKIKIPVCTLSVQNSVPSINGLQMKLHSNTSSWYISKIRCCCHGGCMSYAPTKMTLICHSATMLILAISLSMNFHFLLLYLARHPVNSKLHYANKTLIDNK